MQYRISKYEVVKLGQHAEIFPGYAFESERFTDNPNDVALVKGENVQQGFIDWETAKYWPAADADLLGRFELRPGDVVLAMDRPWVTAGLKWAYIKKHDPRALLVQRVARIRGKAGLDQGYLRCAISSRYFSDYIQPIVTGVNVPHISGKQIGGFRIPLPPPHTQRKIAAILSAYDELIENNRRRIALLEKLAEEIYREWFVRLRFPGHQNVKITKRVPEGWDQKHLPEIADITYGFAFDGARFNSNGSGKPIIRIRNIPESSTTDYTDEVAHEKYIVSNGDLLVGMDGEFHINHWHGDDAYLVQRVCRIRAKNPLLEGYLAHAIRGPVKHFESILMGATVGHLGAMHLKSIVLLVPPKSLEERLHILNDIREQKLTLARSNRHLVKTRDLLLPRLISGKLSVEHLDIQFPPGMAEEVAAAS